MRGVSKIIHLLPAVSTQHFHSAGCCVQKTVWWRRWFLSLCPAVCRLLRFLFTLSMSAVIFQLITALFFGGEDGRNETLKGRGDFCSNCQTPQMCGWVALTSRAQYYSSSCYFSIFVLASSSLASRNYTERDTRIAASVIRLETVLIQDGVRNVWNDNQSKRENISTVDVVDCYLLRVFAWP